MNTQRILGIVLLVAGVALLIVGMNSSKSAVDQVSNAVTGRYTDNTMWYIIGGTISAVAGGAMLFLGFRSKSA